MGEEKRIISDMPELKELSGTRLFDRVMDGPIKNQLDYDVWIFRHCWRLI